jgi:hypothetical protein
MKINRIGSDRKVYIWKQQGESISDQTSPPIVKYGEGNNIVVEVYGVEWGGNVDRG